MGGKPGVAFPTERCREAAAGNGAAASRVGPGIGESMTSSPRRQLRRCVAAAGAFGLAGALAVGSGAAAVAAPLAHGHAGVGVKTPAIGAHPHYQVAGHANPAAPPTFTCQVTTPAQCYGPAQMRAAYGVDKLAAKGLNGAGRTIVIVDAFQSPTISSDLALFDQLFELPNPVFNQIAPDGLTPFDQNDGNMVGWAGEITLDVEWAHAIAPAAKITLVLAKSNDDADILSATRYAVDHNLGDVISQSFGENESCVSPDIARAQHALFTRATLKGITLLASSGDQGSAQLDCAGEAFVKAASSPATDPLVTAVGGTLLDANGLTGAYNGETVWNEPDFAAAGGGGFSVDFGKPIYQVLAQRTGHRGVPDVAYNAGILTGVLAVWSSSGLGSGLVFRFGGTSAGSPQWAGLVALTNQANHGRVGFINPTLYALAATPAYRSLFHDITVGDNTFHGDTDIPGFTAGRGWDAASGLGSPKADALVPLLARLH
jgi:subtilase family serine protease